MTDLEYAKVLFLKVYPDEPLSDKIKSYLSSNSKTFDTYILLCRKEKYKRLFKLNPFEKLCLVFAYLPITKNYYDNLGIGESVFFDTMSDVAIWIDDYKYYANALGLDELNWIVNHLNCKIFKLGRLQFHLSKYFYSAHCIHNGVKISFGDKCLNLHIPRGEKLSLESCYDSFNRAKVFFPKYFPHYPTDIYECFSWIFYSGNADFMNENSNMMKFADLFEKSGNRELPADAMKYIFKIKKGNLELIKHRRKYGHYYDLTDFIPQTSLQSRCKEYVMNGGKLGDCKGRIIFPKNN